MVNLIQIRDTETGKIMQAAEGAVDFGGRYEPVNQNGETVGTVDPEAADEFMNAADEYGVDLSTADDETISLLAATVGTEDEWRSWGLTDEQIQSLGQGVSGLQDTASTFLESKEQYQATTKPTSGGLKILQDALQTVSNVGSQDIGTSKLYEAAGLEASVPSLLTSLQQRGREMQTVYDKYKMRVSDVAQAQADTYNAALDRYKLEMENFYAASEMLNQRANNMIEHQREVELIDRQAQADKDLAEYEAGLAVETEGTFEGGINTDYWNDYLHGVAQSESVPLTNVSTNSSLGGGQVTAYGSYTEEGVPIWEHGVDFYLEGGKGAEIVMPMNGEVIEVDTGHSAGEEDSFGNQVKVRFEDGREAWFSHLDEVYIGPASFEAGTAIGTQGNTGTTYSEWGTPSDDNEAGTHIDITMPKDDGGYYTPQEAASYFGIGTISASEEERKRLNGLITQANLSKEDAALYTYYWANGMYSVDEINETFLKEETTTEDKKQFKYAAIGMNDAIEKGDDPFEVINDTIEDLTAQGHGTEKAVLQGLYDAGANKESVYMYDLKVSLKDKLAMQADLSGNALDILQKFVGTGISSLLKGIEKGTEPKDVSDMVGITGTVNKFLNFIKSKGFKSISPKDAYTYSELERMADESASEFSETYQIDERAVKNDVWTVLGNLIQPKW